MTTFLACVLAACLGAPAQLQAQVDVPGDFANLQQAIDAAAPGGVIVVHGGTHDSIVIDKALTLVGVPAPFLPLIKGKLDAAAFVVRAPIRLDGPGAGEVTLIGLRTAGSLQEGLVIHGEPGILGGGFDQLRILHCKINGCGGDSVATETLQGTPGMAVTVPYVVIEGSTVTAGDTQHAFGGPFPTIGAIGVLAPYSTVTLLDSEVTGGLVFDFLWHNVPDPCPGGCAGIAGGSGGVGIVTAQLYLANSSILGGQGATFTCDTGFVICTKSNGVEIVANRVHSLPDNLGASGPLDQGGSFTLHWYSLGNPALLVLSPGSHPPVLLEGYGLLFVALSQAATFLVPGGGHVEQAFPVPVNGALVGTAFTLQVYDPLLGLTRPVVAAVVP